MLALCFETGQPVRSFASPGPSFTARAAMLGGKACQAHTRSGCGAHLETKVWRRQTILGNQPFCLSYRIRAFCLPSLFALLSQQGALSKKFLVTSHTFLRLQSQSLYITNG